MKNEKHEVTNVDGPEEEEEDDDTKANKLRRAWK